MKTNKNNTRKINIRPIQIIKLLALVFIILISIFSYKGFQESTQKNNISLQAGKASYKEKLIEFFKDSLQKEQEIIIVDTIREIKEIGKQEQAKDTTKKTAIKKDTAIYYRFVLLKKDYSLDTLKILHKYKKKNKGKTNRIVDLTDHSSFFKKRIKLTDTLYYYNKRKIKYVSIDKLRKYFNWSFASFGKIKKIDKNEIYINPNKLKEKDKNNLKAFNKFSPNSLFIYGSILEYDTIKKPYYYIISKNGIKKIGEFDKKEAEEKWKNIMSAANGKSQSLSVSIIDNKNIRYKSGKTDKIIPKDSLPGLIAKDTLLLKVLKKIEGKNLDWNKKGYKAVNYIGYLDMNLPGKIWINFVKKHKFDNLNKFVAGALLTQASYQSPYKITYGYRNDKPFIEADKNPDYKYLYIFILSVLSLLLCLLSLLTKAIKNKKTENGSQKDTSGTESYILKLLQEKVKSNESTEKTQKNEQEIIKDFIDQLKENETLKKYDKYIDIFEKAKNNKELYEIVEKIKEKENEISKEDIEKCIELKNIESLKDLLNEDSKIIEEKITAEINKLQEDAKTLEKIKTASKFDNLIEALENANNNASLIKTIKDNKQFIYDISNADKISTVLEQIKDKNSKLRQTINSLTKDDLIDNCSDKINSLNELTEINNKLKKDLENCKEERNQLSGLREIEDFDKFYLELIATYNKHSKRLEKYKKNNEYISKFSYLPGYTEKHSISDNNTLKERLDWADKLIKDIKEAKDLKDFILKILPDEVVKFDSVQKVKQKGEDFKEYRREIKHQNISGNLQKDLKTIYPILNDGVTPENLIQIHYFYFINLQINDYTSVIKYIAGINKTLKLYNIKDGEALASKLEKYQLHDKFFESNYIRDMFIYFDEKKADYYLFTDLSTNIKTLNPKTSIVAMKLVALFRDYYYYIRFNNDAGYGNIQYKICEDKPIEEIPVEYKKDITTRNELEGLHLPTIEIFFNLFSRNNIKENLDILIRGNNLNPLLKKEIT